MSSSVMSAGLMGPLNRKLTKEERELWSENLYDQDSLVNINYEGTLAYLDIGGSEYGIHFGVSHNYSLKEFDDLNQFNISIIPEQMRPYTCYWYNGVDSDMDMITLEEFLKQTNQN